VKPLQIQLSQLYLQICTDWLKLSYNITVGCYGLHSLLQKAIRKSETGFIAWNLNLDSIIKYTVHPVHSSMHHHCM